jgi:hypothetical protein
MKMRFTIDNTAGYSAASLSVMNAEFDRIVAEWVAQGWDMDARDWQAASRLDAIAEHVLAMFDMAAA